MFGALLEVTMFKKCTPLWCEAHFKVKMDKTRRPRNKLLTKHISKSNAQNTTCSGLFWTLKRRFVWQAQGILPLPKMSKTWGFCSISKNDGRRRTFEEDLQRWISRGRRNTRDMLIIRDARRSGRWSPERGCILEHQIFRFAKVILRDTALHSTFHFWISCRIASFWMVSSSKIEEVSQNCFVLDVFKFQSWGSLAE